MAQAAVESGVETAISVALQLREVHEPLREWIARRSVFTDWSPTNDRVKGLWAAMTGDHIVETPGWEAYVTGVKARHAFAHRAAMVSHEQAVQFIDAAEQVLNPFSTSWMLLANHPELPSPGSSSAGFRQMVLLN